jgi:hypothetical protein
MYKLYEFCSNLVAVQKMYVGIHYISNNNYFVW